MFDWDFYAITLPVLWDGLLVTLALTGVSLLLGGILAVLLTMARASNHVIPRGFVTIYSAFFRGTPLLAQLFFIYYGSAQLGPWFKEAGLWGVFREPAVCAVIAFSLNTAAYQAEIIRGAVNSIQRGQLEAARAMGFDEMTLLTRIIAPLAMRTAIRPYGNEVILMLKGSAVASVVTVYDLLGASKMAFNNTYDYRIYLLCGLIYVFVVEVLRRALGRVELKLNPDKASTRGRFRRSRLNKQSGPGPVESLK